MRLIQVVKSMSMFTLIGYILFICGVVFLTLN
jgi:hypothetical protein